MFRLILVGIERTKSVKRDKRYLLMVPNLSVKYF